MDGFFSVKPFSQVIHMALYVTQFYLYLDIASLGRFLLEALRLNVILTMFSLF